MIAINSIKTLKKVVFPFQYSTKCSAFHFSKTKYVTFRYRTFCTKVETEVCDSEKIIPNPRNFENTRSFISKYIKSESKFQNLVCNLSVSTEDALNKFDSLKLLQQYFETNNPDILIVLPNLVQNEISDLSSKEFLEYLAVFADGCRIKKVQAEGLKDVFVPINDQLFKRFRNISDNEAHQCLHLLFSTKTSPHFTFFFKIVMKSLKYLHKLTPEQMIHIMFLMTCFSKDYLKEVKFKMMKTLHSTMPHFNITDVLVITFAFSVVKMTVTHPELIKSILQKLRENIDEVDEKTFSFISKLTSKHHKWIESEIQEFQELCISYMPRLSLHTLSEVMFMNMGHHTVNHSFFDICMKRIKENMNKCSFECADSVLSGMLNLNLLDEEFVQLVENKLEREVESGIRTEGLFNYLPVLVQLSFLSRYNEDLLKALMTEDFARLLVPVQFRRNYKIWWWLHLNYTLELEKPEFSCKLDSNLKKTLWTIMNYNNKNFRVYRKNNYLLNIVLEAMFGEENCAHHSPLTHCPYIMTVVRLDKNLKCQPFPEKWKIKPKHELRRAEEDDHLWVAFYSTIRMHYGINDEEANYYKKAYDRQLIAAGYKPFTVRAHNFRESPVEESSRKNCINLIQEKLREIAEGKIEENEPVSV